MVIFASADATLSLGYVEVKLCNICNLKYRKFWVNCFKERCNRLFDDCYMFFRSTQVINDNTFIPLNSIDSLKQLFMWYGKNKTPFLDIFIEYNETCCTWMDIDQKPTHTQSISHFRSSYLNYCKQNVSLCLAWMICTIVVNNAQSLNLTAQIYKEFTNHCLFRSKTCKD